MMKIMRKIVLIVFFSLLFFSFTLSLVLAGGTGCPPPPPAGGLVPCGNVDTCPCELRDFFVMIDRVIDFLLFYIVPPLAALMIAIGGGMYIFAFGRPEMISRAKKLFWSVAIGLLIIYGAWVLVNTFLTVMGVTKWQGFGQGWWIIE